MKAVGTAATVTCGIAALPVLGAIGAVSAAGAVVAAADEISGKK